MKRFEGKVAVVTGGNSGIGLATAQRLHEEGARVAIAGRSKKTLDEAVKTIGNGVVAVQADVAKFTDVDKLYAEVSRKLGKIDVLFVNAGVAKFAPFAETSESTYDENFDINIKGAYFTIQKALPFLNDGASIILNALSRQNYGGGIGWARYPRERGCAGPDCDPDPWKDRAAKGSHRSIREGCNCAGSDEALWTARGSGRRRGVLGFARCVVHHRY
jgi:NAD(P)-dependent dehydrogenase (short-subunit alcohol dehydrogenase family)